MALPDEKSVSGKDDNQEKGSNTLNFREKSSILKLMGSFSSSSAASSSENVPGTDQDQVKISKTSDGGEMVKLNVYGLSEVNKVINYFGLGIYHSGVEVYGSEWAYGGYPKPIASIYRMRKPRDLTSLSDIDGRFHFVQTIEMGKTHFTLKEVKMILDNLGKTDWIGTNYHLLYRNCNSFSTEFCKILCGNTIPPWINRVATIFSKFPYLVSMLPEEFFTPVALQEKLREEQVQKYQLLKACSKMENEKSTASSASVEIKSNQIDEVEKSKSNISKSALTIKSTTSTLEKSEKSMEMPLKKSPQDFKVNSPNLSEKFKPSSPSPSLGKVNSEKVDEKSSKGNI
ncbi:PREDICTED: desumoylating isopeptidase 2-like [Rhagoletis zephyria]|uniref:desumoylating isopeptidase 2-like n=1 Tax=Rhagoletis zephyria TaxID=28612 RepID=UPI0008115F4E|nr:PREDICTED: desumoylating isopeptidase 2-like [Rhagoletis zephyria]